ncbi:MAG: WD40 repeat domain-containing protein [Cyanobacteria bacterium]|nr:WD40 repeat domain-containing protein [Cyanobacteriota bacterium]
MNPNWLKTPQFLGKGTIRQGWLGARSKAQRPIGWSALLAGLGTIAITGGALAAVRTDRVQVAVTPDQVDAPSALLGSPAPQQITLNPPEVVGAEVWAAGQEPRTLDHSSYVGEVAVSADGSTIVTLGEDGIVKAWAAG